jgi:Ca2+/Na+ antiporter
MGYYRPPGTFSFTNGAVLFFSMATSYIFYFWLRPSNMNRLVLLAATAGLILAIPLSISRALLFSVVVIAMFVFVIIAQNPKMIGRVIVAAIGLVVLVILLGNLEVFQTSTEVFTSRFDSAARAEGGLEGTLGERYLGGMLHAITSASERPFFGKGLGIGTNAGSVLLSGEAVFLVSEGEWGRVVGEMGALLGLMVIAIRLLVSFKVSLAGYARLKQGDILPWLLLGFALIVFPQGQWAQPTTLGFSTMIMGLLIGSFNEAPKKHTTKNREDEVGVAKK